MKRIDWISSANRRLLKAAALVFCACFVMARTAGALETGATAHVTATDTATDTAAETRTLLADLGQTLSEALKAETENTRRYQEKLDRLEQEKIYLDAALNGYQLQLSTYGNLPLSETAEINALNRARSEMRGSLAELQRIMSDTAPLIETLAAEEKNLTRQKELVTGQLAELQRMKANGTDVTLLETSAEKLSQTLTRKQQLLERLGTDYRERLDRVAKVMQGTHMLTDQLAKAVEQRQAKDLFRRQTDLKRFESLRRLGRDAGYLAGRLREAATLEFWKKWFAGLWEAAGLVLVSLALILAGAAVVLNRIRKGMDKILYGTWLDRLGKFHAMARTVLSGTFLHAGMTVLLLLYSRLSVLYLMESFLTLAAHLSMTALVVRWLILALAHWPPDAAFFFSAPKRISRLIRGSGIFCSAYLVLRFFVGQEASLLIFLRLAFSLWLLAWALAVWHKRKQRQRREKQGSAPGTPPHPESTEPSLTDRGAQYLLTAVGGTALVLDMVGYGPLSFHWLVSWGRSVPLLFWWAVFFFLIREWDTYYREKSRSSRNEFLYDDYPVQWLMIRFCQLIWVISLVMLMLLAWGNKQTVLSGVYQTLSSPLKAGNMQFSIMGIVYAALVLGGTYALTKLWRWIFQSKFLSRSGMAPGLQDSITTITVYVIWLFGVFIALHVFGLNTTSLTVAFGALGIGLGFGLQNIFNNFISGIILLFERPIQVGDDVEINNTWATVKKINVRSTVVQTYDNASLIIPNADFISSLVTNWSFKDKRLRRSINVGVAYGSDVVRVRDTLLEIAAKTPKVLKYPKPDVLFRDFGDSALVFRLRVWTDIDSMLVVENDIRFEIDRLFRERDIEISFPQRDIHIRSVSQQAGPMVAVKGDGAP